MIENCLTIVLTLKGQHNFTKRWLAWAETEKCPYKILIADGSIEDTIKLHLENKKYKNIKYEYYRFPPDNDLNAWFLKIKQIHEKVETDYVIQADNDDFILFKNLPRNIKILDDNPDGVCISMPHYRMKFHSKGNNKLYSKKLYSNKIKVRKLRWSSSFNNLTSIDAETRLSFTIKNFN